MRKILIIASLLMSSIFNFASVKDELKTYNMLATEYKNEEVIKSLVGVAIQSDEDLKKI